ncbi:unnamed protein product, partial [Didymodactylos carnosus]
MVALRGVTIDGDQKKTNIRIIEDYTKNIMYYIDLDGNVCSKQSLPLKLMHCVPDTATYIQSFMYGYGDKQIPGHTWFFKADNYVMYITVSGDGHCVPLSETVFIGGQTPMITSLTITDFTEGIKDR